MRWTGTISLGRALANTLLLLAAAAATAAVPDSPTPASAPASAPAAPVRPLALSRPLIAHWTFDEDFGAACRDASGNGNDASLQGPAAALTRSPGVFGNAASFTGQHHLRVPPGQQGGLPDFRKAARLSFSAWARPAAFERYNEIFRKEDGDSRVLFSFQENATALSLGLNVGGYVECRAHIEPKWVQDESWHHCAATFDGQAMRVYLDGREIGFLARPGALTAGGAAAGCIGSCNGGECFQGDLDDLRIYADALPADEIVRLYRNGMEAVVRQDKALRQDLPELRAEGKTFAQALADWRRLLAEAAARPDRRQSEAIRRLLRAHWPEEAANFAAWTGVDPAVYLTAREADTNERLVRPLIDLLVEFRPLTDRQWKAQTPEQLAQWKDAEAVERKFEALRKFGRAGQFSAGWVELVLEAGPKIVRRPSVQEAVAPYVRPATPATGDLSAEEARAAQERDWLHQADGRPTPRRVRDEIGWARQIAGRVQPARGDFAAELAQLDALQKRADAATGDDAPLYFQVRAVKRAIMFRNPAVNFDKLLFVDMPFPQGSEWNHETRHRLGYMAVPGARLLTLTGLSPAGHLTQLAPAEPLHGSFWRPDVSFDGRKVLFCFKPHNEKSFHLYEMDVDPQTGASVAAGAGGRGGEIRQLTDGPYDDLDPIYLPGGHIAFSTTRGHTYVRCMPPTNAFVLARCDADGRNIYLISSNNEPDYLPSVMNDGRIIYTRWEYTDKPLWRAEKLWAVNPDGTAVTTVWGNQSVWPDLIKDARAIPGSRRVMFTGSAHHDWFSGSVGIIDPDRGLNFPDGLAKVTADTAWPECGNGPVDPVESSRYHRGGNYAAYYSPYPLGERDFLVSANRGGKFVLYLMDTDGNRELVYEGTHNIFHAMPLAPRAMPPALPDRVAWPARQDRLHPAGGVIYSYDIYQGAPEELRGKARSLRVLSIDHKTYTYWNQRPYLSTGPVVSAVQSDGVKRVLGTVPIEPDGSVAFDAPAGVPLHFQLLDENGRALQTMRSFTGVMPGERRGCLGCHELHSTTPNNDPQPALPAPGAVAAVAGALAHPPRTITPPPWPDQTVSYPRYVRPVLDKYCAQCHQGEGKGRKTLDLTPRVGFLFFEEAYLLFTGRPTWGEPYRRPDNPPPGFGIADTILVEGYHQRDPAAYQTPRPMTYLSYRSRLIDIAASGKHHDVKVDPISLQRLRLWVDTMCPYRGEEEIRDLPDPVFQGVDWLSVRPLIKTAPRIVRPGPVD